MESKRLKLIEFEEKYIDNKVMSWFENKDLMKFYTNSKKKIDKNELIHSVITGKNEGESYTYLISFKETDELIGTVKLGPINKAHKISDLVTLIGEKRDYYGKGIGTEAIQLAIKLAFEKYDIRKLFGGMYRSNIPSIKAYTRAGWIIEGVLKGHYLVNGKNEDRILVGCFNPKYFTEEEIESARYENWQ